MTSKRILQLVLGLALLTLALPAMALPRPCDAICDCDTPCFVRCTVGSFVTSCGGGGVCAGRCFAAAAPRTNDALLAAIYDASNEAAQPVSTPQPVTQAGSVETAQQN